MDVKLSGWGCECFFIEFKSNYASDKDYVVEMIYRHLSAHFQSCQLAFTNLLKSFTLK